MAGPQKHHSKPADAEAGSAATRRQQSKSGQLTSEPVTSEPARKLQPDPAEGDRRKVEHELKQQTEKRKAHAKAEMHADRPRDSALKPERKGVI